MGFVDRLWLAFAALCGAAAVAGGAYASHGLSADVAAQELFNIAGRYQMWHALALIGLIILVNRAGGGSRLALRVVGWLFVLGTVMFSGAVQWSALYGPLPWRNTAPMGGSALILGWVILALTAIFGGRGFFERRG